MNVDQILRCPRCKGDLRREGSSLHCVSVACGLKSAEVAGIPVLLNPDRSLFDPNHFTPHAKTTFVAAGSMSERIGRWLPCPSRDLAGDHFYSVLAAELRRHPRDRRRVLVVGCGNGSARYGELREVDDIVFVETDVSLAGPAQIVCDASDLPFANASFDLVVCQAVLEHVLEPQRCVDEIHRVLADDGIAYATVPFMQHVHMGAYDFTRFTHSGLRWLFRKFEEVDSGLANGPGSMLAWSVEYFWLASAEGTISRRIVKAVNRLLFAWINVFDLPLARRRGAYDAAGGFYFLGRRAATELPARAMLEYYRGADSAK